MANQQKDVSPEEASYLEWRDELRADPQYEAIYKEEAAKGELWLNQAEPHQAAKPSSEEKSKRTVYQREDQRWVNKRNDAGKATSVHSTQKDAVDHARQNLKNQGGGELIIKGRDGKIRSKDTILPGNDPNPPKDKGH